MMKNNYHRWFQFFSSSFPGKLVVDTDCINRNHLATNKRLFTQLNMATTKLPRLRTPEDYRRWSTALRLNAAIGQLDAPKHRLSILSTVDEKSR